MIEETGAEILRPQLAEVRAERARLAGDREAHHEALREAHRLYSAMGATAHATRLAAALDCRSLPG